MAKRAIHAPRGRRVRRRRRLAVAGITAVCALIALVLLLDARGGVSHPGEWLANSYGVRRERIKVKSAAVGLTLPTEVLLPKNYDKSDRRPILVLLHGRGSRPDQLSNKAQRKALADAGPNAPIVALPYGGAASYWHDRSAGDWGRYVTGEVIPAVAAKFGGDRRRVAIGGVSMGGFGAFDLARLHPGRFCALGGHSPALWQTGGETAAGAFDDAADFARNDVIAVARNRPSAYHGMRIWIDAGDQDPFQPGDQAMIAALRQSGADLQTHAWRGGHDGAYWNAHFGAYLRFYTRALARCRS